MLVDFWTYSCINCLNHLPYVKAWNEKYKDQGLVVYKTTEKKIQALLAEQPRASPSPGS